jgi:tetratricopeptide (TPR) repeat protein
LPQSKHLTHLLSYNVKNVKLLALALIIALSSALHAQTARPVIPDDEQANEHFAHGNYLMALPIYLELVKRHPKNLDYNYRTGICFLRTNGRKSESIRYFEFVTTQPKFENDAWLYLGQAYQYTMRFDDAVKAYETYKLKADKSGIANADRYIMQCGSGKLLVENPLDVTFTNLGKEVNTEFPEYYPFVTSDETMLAFTSRRKGNIGAAQVEMDGYYASDIFISRSLNGTYQKAKNAGPLINGNYDELCTGLSADGTWMTVYVDNISNAGDLYLSTSTKTSFGKLEKFADNPKKEYVRINGGFETSASLSPDGNIIFFSSKRDGGQGGTDIYMARKLPGDNGWGLPQNLTMLNTPLNEEFPTISPDGKTLYFSSQGFNGMGGYDLFVTVWDEENNSWSTPRNVGYPINSPGDDLTICFTENNRVAYVSSDREGGQGDLDIWRVVFNEVQRNTFTIVTGQVQRPDATFNYADLTIYVTSVATSEDFGTYRTNPVTGRFVIALPPGKYILTVDAPGCKPYMETLNVFDIDPPGEMSKDILLTKL